MGSVQYELVTLVAHDLSFTQASLLQSQQLSPHNPTLFCPRHGLSLPQCGFDTEWAPLALRASSTAHFAGTAVEVIWSWDITAAAPRVCRTCEQGARGLIR